MRKPLNKPARAVMRILPGLLLGLLAWPPPAAAALLELSPGPIERPRHVAAADFDRDGFDDLVVANFQAGTLHLLINQRDGTFAPHPTSPILVGFATFTQATSGPLQILVADLNPEDTDSDRVLDTDDNCPNVANPGQEDVETAAGFDGLCGTADDNPALNGPDGVCGTGDDLSGNGTGDACQTLDAAGNAVDPDADGVPTYAPATGALDNCPAMLNPKTCSNAPATQCAADVDCPSGGTCRQSDADGDGVGDACAASPDMVILENSLGAGAPQGIVRVRVNNGAGDMLSRPSKSTGVAPSQALLADFDGDGRLDLLFANRADDQMRFLAGLADGEFAVSRAITTGDGPQGLAAGDFDGDGDLDLTVANSCDHTLTIYENPGTGIPDQAAYTIMTSAQPTALLAGRLDGDALDDLLLLSRGDMVCEAAKFRAGMCCADNRDCEDPKDPANNGNCGPSGPATGLIQVYLGSSTLPPVLNIAATRTLAPDENAAAGLLLDLNGDNALDLAVADFGKLSLAAPAINSGQVLLYAGAGDGTLAAPVALAGLPQPVALAPLDVDPATPGRPDLAVLMFGANRVDLFLNPDDGGLGFTPAPTSPASPWKGSVAMALFGADPAVGIDLVLPQKTPPRLDVLSGIGTGVFSALPTMTLEAPFQIDGMVVTDLKDDSRPDMALFGAGRVCTGGPQDGERCRVAADCADPADPGNNGTCDEDPSAGTVTVVTNEFTGLLIERDTVAIAAPVTAAASGSLITSADDFDRDGILNSVDNCPTRFNPPACGVAAPACRFENPCADSAVNPVDCAILDPATGQCDSDGNGIGDHCQNLSATCEAIDGDADLKFDYDPNALVRAAGGLDFDRDDVANASDNCPHTANLSQLDVSPANGVGDACQAGTDVNGNGIIESGRFCSATFASCSIDADCPVAELCLTETVDTDLDGIPDYDPGPPAALDNCPAVFNPGQEDNDGDGVGNACVIRAALDNCPLRSNPGQEDADGDGVANICEALPVQDVITVSLSAGAVNLFTGDGTGALHEASFSPIDGLAGPSAAASGQFSVSCGLGVFFCSRKPTNDLVVAETVDPLDPADDRLVVYLNGDAGYLGNCDAGICTAPIEASGTCLVATGICAGGPNAGNPCADVRDCGRACLTHRDCARLPPAPAAGNVRALLTAPAQRVCSSASAPASPGLRFAQDNRTTVIAAVQPDTASLGIFLPGNQTLIDASRSSLVPPPGRPAPLPLPAPLLDAAFADINGDRVEDLVALSGADGDPATPNVTIYLGIGNGLFFTDPTFNPTNVPDGAVRMALGNVNLAADSFFPEVVLFSAVDEAPIVLTNILIRRADIDGSGRVDGFDLAVLSRAFGATRGEDFVLTVNPADGLVVLDQTADPMPFRRVLVPAPGPVTGQNIPDSDGFCNSVTDSMKDPVTGAVRYGLAADINLDGIVDGVDLAILASRFGRRP